MVNPRVVTQRLFKLSKSSEGLCRISYAIFMIISYRACDLVRSNVSLGMTDRDEFTSRKGSIRPRFLRTKDLRTRSRPTCPFIDPPVPDTKSYRALSIPSWLKLQDKIPRENSDMSFAGDRVTSVRSRGEGRFVSYIEF